MLNKEVYVFKVNSKDSDVVLVSLLLTLNKNGYFRTYSSNFIQLTFNF